MLDFELRRKTPQQTFKILLRCSGYTNRQRLRLHLTLLLAAQLYNQQYAEDDQQHTDTDADHNVHTGVWQILRRAAVGCCVRVLPSFTVVRTRAIDAVVVGLSHDADVIREDLVHNVPFSLS